MQRETSGEKLFCQFVLFLSDRGVQSRPVDAFHMVRGFVFRLCYIWHANA